MSPLLVRRYSRRHIRFRNIVTVDKNLALQQDLYKLRSDTKNAFDEAKSLEARWKDLEREQREIYQVTTPAHTLYPILTDKPAIDPTIPPNEIATRNDRSR